MANSWHAFVLFICFTLIVFDFNHAAVRRPRSLPNIFGNLGRNFETTTRNIFHGQLGILNVNVVGGQKNNANNPCDPSQYNQQASTLKPALINIKIPTIFSRGRNQQPTLPPNCPPTSANPTVQPYPSVSVGGHQSESPTQRPSSANYPSPSPTSTNSYVSSSSTATSTHSYVSSSSTATSTAEQPIIFPQPRPTSTLAPTTVTKPSPTQQLVQSSTSASSTSSTGSPTDESSTPDMDQLIDSIFNQADEPTSKPSDINGAGIIDLRWRGKQKK